jgi:hypothetical protein
LWLSRVGHFAFLLLKTLKSYRFQYLGIECVHDKGYSRNSTFLLETLWQPDLINSISKSLGARKQNGLRGIATMDYGHLCQSENTLSCTCTAQKDTRLTLLTYVIVFLCSIVECERLCRFYWYCWNCWPSLIKLSLHRYSNPPLDYCNVRNGELFPFYTKNIGHLDGILKKSKIKIGFFYKIHCILFNTFIRIETSFYDIYLPNYLIFTRCNYSPTFTKLAHVRHGRSRKLLWYDDIKKPIAMMNIVLSIIVVISLNLKFSK